MNIKYIIRGLKLVCDCYPKGFVLKMLYVFIQSMLPLISLLVLKQLVDSVTAASGSFATFTGWVLAFCGVWLAGRWVGVLSGVNNDIMSQRLIDHISEKIQHQAYELDMAYYDNPQYHDTFHRAQQEATSRPIQLYNTLMGTIGSAVALIGIVFVLANTAWWIILLMLVAVVPSFIVKSNKARTIYRFRKSNTQNYRKTNYYSTLLSNRIYAKEMRTFGLAGLFRERFVTTRKQLVDVLLKISKRLAHYDAMCAFIEVFALGLITLYLAKGTIEGVFTVGVFVMAFEAFRKGEGYLHGVVDGVTGLYESRLFLTNIFDFLELKPRIVSPENPEPFPQEVEKIEFVDVTFRYPDMRHDVLENFNFAAEKGNITLIEGRNGYGKTTMLKLLLRLYDVNGGAIKINGIDIRKFDPIVLRKHVGAIFQDYVQFNCTLRENIEFGDLYSSEKTEARMLNAARLSGVDEIAERLPQGYDTLLGRIFDGGEELSMGQWQRVALARQLYSEAPILVFDEPTAWMDIETRRKLENTLEELKTKHLIILIKHI